MKWTFKRLLALFLALMLCVSLFPSSALAQDAEPLVPEEETVNAPVPEEAGVIPVVPEESGETSAAAPAVEPDALPGAEALRTTANGQCGDILFWALADGVLTISGSGDMWDFGMNSAPWYEYWSEITAVEIQPGAVGIGGYAFYKCRNLTEVTIPEGVTRIGDYAFQFCSALTAVTIPEGVTVISSYAFSDCSALEAVTIPGSVTGIGAFAFKGCRSLTELTIEEGVTEIGDSAFTACSSLTEVTIPASVTRIGDFAFIACSNLTEICFEGSAPAIGNNAFGSVTATAYYPAGDESWTEDVMQNYGGEITWASYEPEPDHTPGDVNGDGQVNTADVALLAKYVKARGQGVTADAAALDVNGDGQVNTADVALLAKFVKARGQGVEIH